MTITGITGSDQTVATTAASASASAAASGSSSSSATPSVSSVYYASPVVTFDSATGAIIEEWRDSKTGAELYQSPTQAALLYAHTQALGRGEGASSKGSAASLSTAAQASLLPVPPAASVPVSSSAGSRAIYG